MSNEPEGIPIPSCPNAAEANLLHRLDELTAEVVRLSVSVAELIRWRERGAPNEGEILLSTPPRPAGSKRHRERLMEFLEGMEEPVLVELREHLKRQEEQDGR